ncbi:response regulator [Marinicellulosiphila megalodicopiae]|uniref:response regulator n=1 Tax=Marinicellulosiphila megalodicopiae TaxID=2724896 RepID=UPI003BAEC72D
MTSKILIVDDERNIRRALKRLINDIDVEIFEAGNGHEALECVDNHPDIKVVISDQRMPKMGGAELFERLAVQHESIKRILITGFTDLESIRSTINDGSVYRLILKPWDDDELLLSVVQAINDFELADENKKLHDKILTINKDLEKKVDQKTRVLQVNIKSLEMSRRILDELPVAIYCINEEGVIIESNEMSKTVLGCNGAIDGLNYHNVFSDSMIQAVETNSKNNILVDEQKWMPMLSSLNGIEGKILIMTRAM